MQALCRSYLRGFSEIKNFKNPNQNKTKTLLAAVKVFSYLAIPLPIMALVVLATCKVFSKKPPTNSTTTKTNDVANQIILNEQDTKTAAEMEQQTKTEADRIINDPFIPPFTSTPTSTTSTTSTSASTPLTPPPLLLSPQGSPVIRPITPTSIDTSSFTSTSTCIATSSSTTSAATSISQLPPLIIPPSPSNSSIISTSTNTSSSTFSTSFSTSTTSASSPIPESIPQPQLSSLVLNPTPLTPTHVPLPPTPTTPTSPAMQSELSTSEATKRKNILDTAQKAQDEKSALTIKLKSDVSIFYTNECQKRARLEKSFRMSNIRIGYPNGDSTKPASHIVISNFLSRINIPLDSIESVAL